MITGTKKAETKKEYDNVECKVTRCKQFADGNISFDMVANGIYVNNCKVIAGRNGDFIAFPSYKGVDGKYYNYAYFRMSPEAKEDIFNQIGGLL